MSKFNGHKQEHGESADSFMKICDHIVIKIKDVALPEKLQQDPELMLNRSVSQV